MSAFGNCIELLDDINQFEVTVQGLGKAHKKIGINVGHLGVSMPVLLYVYRPQPKSAGEQIKMHRFSEFSMLLHQTYMTKLKLTIIIIM